VTTLVVPSLDEEPWPTLGPGVCDFWEAFLPHGPGDIRGQPTKLDLETRALIYRSYEVYPRDHPQAGRRRFKTVAWSLRKGTAKTEKLASVAACELHPDAPVRTEGWRKVGKLWEPVGRGVIDPYIPLVAYTEEQSNELAFYALYVILSEGPLADDFDIGLERIMRIAGDGRCVSLASAPDSRDGARTTFQGFDETHRMATDRLREAHQTMAANIPKRFKADAWSMETTTAAAIGERSIAETTMRYAEALADGRDSNPRMFFFHRQAGDDHDLTTAEGARAAVIEASGPALEWSDVESIMALWADPRTDRTYWERVWTNRPGSSGAAAFDSARWAELADSSRTVAADDVVVLGFSGGRWSNATALIATHVVTGHQFTLGLWERPVGAKDWAIDLEDVERAVAAAFDTFDVWRMYANPVSWETQLDAWRAKYNRKRGSRTEVVVVDWWVNRPRPMAYAVRAYATAIRAGELSHDDDPGLTRHIGNARRRELDLEDDVDEADTPRSPLWVIQKERPDSPNLIDAATAACLSWDARGHCITANVPRNRRRGAKPFFL
jgi:hypothetical protein